LTIAAMNVPKARLRLFGLAVVVGACGGREAAEPPPSTAAVAAPTSAASTASTAAPPGMTLIAGGEFTMGTDDELSMPNERPAHRVRVDAFWLDEHPVTNAEFRRFVEATGYITTAERKPDWEELKKQLPPGTPKPDESMLVPGSLVFTPPDRPVPLDNLEGWWRWKPGADWRHPEGPASDLAGREDHPVVQVSWEDAVAYAKWAGKRLPTEAEWERAARGGIEGARYSWGQEFQPNGRHMANTFQGHFPDHGVAEDGYLATSPVAAFPPNAYGLYDMAGNVWQWTADLYSADYFVEQASQGLCENPTGPDKTFDPADPYSERRVIKGGSFLCHTSYCESYRPSARRGTPPDTGSSHVGFRLALSAPPGY
jgi:sulfatase modifying factor 1